MMQIIWIPWHKAISLRLDMKFGELSLNILADHPHFLFSKEGNCEF